jgi:hypothetical protein
MVLEPFLQQANLHLVKLARNFLAVTGNKRHCGPLLQQGYGLFDLSLLQPGVIDQDPDSRSFFVINHCRSVLF